MDDALGIACRELADMTGTCPYDQHNDECRDWETDCHERCQSDIDTDELLAGCWRRYFEEKEAMNGSRD